MSLVINFSIDKWAESMLSITSGQKCSLIHLVIPKHFLTSETNNVQYGQILFFSLSLHVPVYFLMLKFYRSYFNRV